MTVAAKRPMRIAFFGAGFWAPFQIAGWKELEGAEIVGIYNRTRGKAEQLAKRFGIPAVADDPHSLIAAARPDVVDVITDVGSHAELVELAAKAGLPVICQKPLAADLATAERMAATCQAAGVQLLVHENWRWQSTLRAVKRAIETEEIGRVFRARVDFITGFPVFQNQPFLRELEQFILTDIGTHILDAARFLFGEASRVYCQTHRVHNDIRGEDVATVVLRMHGTDSIRPAATVTCNMSYAENFLRHDRFPQTFLAIEGERGSIELGPDYWMHVTTRDGTQSTEHPPKRYAWVDPAYEIVQSSIVDCCADLLACLRGEKPAETTGEDNLQTLRLVFAAYESASRGQAVAV
jgi:D-apiose dehydrogenase